MSLDIQALNEVFRRALSPEEWAEGVYAAICCGEPDERVQAEIIKASEDERQALGRLLTNSVSLFKEGPFTGGPFPQSTFRHRPDRQEGGIE